MSTAIKWQIATAADPTVTRIIPALAEEIGLNESIVLLQIAFWIHQSDNEREGIYWTYQSLREMHRKAFPYFSIATLRRTILSLRDQGYILIGNFNKRKNDTTQWFALEPDKLSSLKSIIVVPADAGVSKRNTARQNETRVFQNGTGKFQNETTLPEIPSETPTETPTENKSLAPVGAGAVTPPDDLPLKGKDETPKDTTPGLAVNAIIAAYLATGGAYSLEIIQPNAYGNKTMRAGAKALHERGITPEIVTAYLKAKRTDRFWHEKPIKWDMLLSEIVGYHERTRPQWQPAPDEPDPYAHLTTPLRVPGKKSEVNR